MTYYRVIKISLNNDIIMIAYIGNIDFRQTYLKIYSIFYEQLWNWKEQQYLKPHLFYHKNIYKNF